MGKEICRYLAGAGATVAAADINLTGVEQTAREAETWMNRLDATFAQAGQSTPAVHILMGESYDIQENWPSAMAEYQKAIEQAPSLPRLHFDLHIL